MLRPNPGTLGYALGSVIAAGSVVGMLKEAVKSKQELPEETVSPIVSLNVPYLTTGGDEINLPVQEDVPTIVELPDETLPSEPVPTNDLPQLNETEHHAEYVTMPCKIVVRKLDANDINFWKPKTAKCTTASDPDIPHFNYLKHQLKVMP